MALDDNRLSILRKCTGEIEERLERMNEGVLALEENPHDKEILNEIFREVHTLKGISSMLELEHIRRLTDKMEDLLDQLRQDRVTFDSQMSDILLAGSDEIKIQIYAVLRGQSLEGAGSSVEILCDRLDRAVCGTLTGSGGASKEVQATVPGKSREQAAGPDLEAYGAAVEMSLAGKTTNKTTIDMTTRETKDKIEEVRKSEESEINLLAIIVSFGSAVVSFLADYVKEIAPIQKIVQVPGARDYVIGIFNHRGNVEALIDARKLLNLKIEPIGKSPHTLLAEIGEIRLGIYSDEVIDLIDIEKNSIDPPPSLFDEKRRDFLIGEISYKGKKIPLFSIERLVQALLKEDAHPE